MATIIANGTVTLTTGGNNFAYAKIKVGGLTPDDQILATARPGKKGLTL